MSDIIDCDGKYEVHPKLHGGWAVVNGETGSVRCEFSNQVEAVKVAKTLNSDATDQMLAAIRSGDDARASEILRDAHRREGEQELPR